ncbi:MAG TPA: hypothetical protein VFW40_01130 [Capsulimonadaceae bacterium]|nr:hypothetical protein [Capsulimonadaceae bacterium]
MQRYLFLLMACSLLSGCGRQVEPAQSRAAAADIQAQAKAYPAELAKARRLGLPLSLQALNSALPQAKTNAALVYQRLGHLLRAYPLSSKELALEGLSTSPMPTEKALGFARQALVHRARYLKMIHEAAALPNCVFTHDWSAKDPENIYVPEMGTLREASLLLTGQSVLMSKSGQTLAAVKNEAVGFRLADQIAGERILAAYEVACDVDNITLTGLQKILYISHGDPQIALAVQEAIAQQWHPHSLAVALKSEVAFQQAMVSFARAEGPQPFYDTLAPAISSYGFQNEKSGSPAWNKLMDANAAVLLQETTQAIGVADMPFSTARSAIKAVVADSMRHSASRIFSAYLVPDLADDVSLRAQAQARAEITSAAAAVLAWKATHGSFPDALIDAMPAAPQDPFTGGALRYKNEGQGFVLYSAGPSGTFNGGSPQSEPAMSESVFRYPLPSYDFPAKPGPAVAA